MKEKLIELLELELKARQWYGPDIPVPYFRNVGSELMQAIANDGLYYPLHEHVVKLEKIMFLLAEQIGGTPRAFRNAYDAATATDGDAATATVGDDDVVVVQPAAAEAVVVIDLTDE
jgi:hypothetical protein